MTASDDNTETQGTLAELIDELGVERIEKFIFRGRSRDPGWGRVFGGQVLGQCLSAASDTVPSERSVHSLHGYFLRPGDASKPVMYTVDPIRDGGSFTTRRVVAVQDGCAIFNMSVSFQVVESGLTHQSSEMPDVPAPEALASERELQIGYLDDLPKAVLAAIPTRLVERARAIQPIEMRPVEPIDPRAPGKRPPTRRVWLRASGSLPNRPRVHEHLLAYASDFQLLGATMQPHGVTWLSPGMQLASLDHAMWFHREFRFDDWLLYDIEAPTAQGSRGLARGQLFTRDGVLVASTMQEALIRDRRRPRSP